MKQLILSLIMLALVLQSCSESTNSSNSGTPAADNNILPLKVGNEWHYQDILIADNETITGESRNVVTRIQDVEIENKLYKAFAIVEYNTNNEAVYQKFISRTSVGIYNFASENDPFNLKYRNLTIKYPSWTNERWDAINHNFTNLSHRFSHDTCSVICLGTKEDIKVPAGDFRCSKYQYEFKNNSKIIEWWAVGAGLVRYEYYDDKGEIIRKRELKRLIIE
ncbi:MAG: hypothetical protein KIT33_04105 [Candidatus Kapabacteria bacterium]|nr:hypothetical protein [Ignavibacteriota bacterium]MCW5884138.1 hypothetical protein [Candidatus Kapabacteria bacterium]